MLFRARVQWKLIQDHCCHFAMPVHSVVDVCQSLAPVR
jgi:hypothetical protein